MSARTINKSIFIAASREVVWSFLTSKEKLSQWFHRADVDLEQGKDYAFFEKSDDGTDMKIIWGSVLTAQAPAELSFTFIFAPLGDGKSTVTFSLEEVHGGTKLSLEHVGIGDVAAEAALGLLMAIDQGWDAHFGKLREQAA